MKVLVIQQRFGIGDQVIFTNYYHNIAKKLGFPITLLAKKSSRAKDLFAEDKYINGIIELSNQNDGTLGFFKLLKQVKLKKFDIVFIFNGSLRYFLLAKLAGIKKVYQYPLFKSKDIIFETAKELTESFLKKPVDTQPKLILEEKTIQNAKKKYEFDNSYNHIVFGLSASGKSTKVWPIENFIELAKKINSVKRSKFYLACGKDDSDLISKFLNSSLKDNCISLNNLTIQEILPIIKNSKFYVGNDTGFMHISSALGLNCIGIFGDSPAYAYSAYSKNIYAVVPEGEDLKTTTHNTRGINKISVLKVFEKVTSLIS